MLARWMILLIFGVFLIVFESSCSTSTLSTSTLATSTLLHRWEHGDWVYSVAYSPDGKTILTGSKDNIARLYYIQTGELIKSWEHAGNVYSVAYSPDGKTILTGSWNNARLYEIKTGEMIHKWEHDTTVRSVAYSPDGKTILTGSGNLRTIGEAQLYEIQTGEMIHKWEHSGWVLSVVYSPDGKTILTGSRDNTARLYDIQTGEMIHKWRHDSDVVSVVYSPDGKNILTGSDDNTARLYDIQTGEMIHRWEHAGNVYSVAYSPDGKNIITGSGGGREGAYYGYVRLYDIKTGELIHRWEHGDWVRSVVYSPDGKTILTGGEDNTAQLYDIQLYDILPSDPQTQTHRQLVMEIQQGLHDLGYHLSVIDGITDDRTSRAIRSFEQDHGLPITGQVSPALKTNIMVAYKSKQSSEIPSNLEKSSTGSGFFISPEGHLITNHHVVDECTEVRLTDGTKLERIAHNEQDDLALYQDQSKSEEHSFVPFRAGREIRPGEDIVVLGFPFSSSLSSSLKATTGIVSSLLGDEDDRSRFQITASVNPGNSGGPVLDNTGQVVGVVVSRLVNRNRNGRPVQIQNVNFAIHLGIVRLFLAAHGIPYELNLSPVPLETADIVTQGENYTVLLECWK